MIKMKKGQEEMVGFVLIVLIVVIIAVVLLGISLRNQDDKKDVQQSEELGSFLSSIRHVTTECERSERKQSIGQLVGECYKGRECMDGTSSCEVLDSVLKEILENSNYQVSKDSVNVYYELSIYDESDVNLIESLRESVDEECKFTRIWNEEKFTMVDFEKVYMRFEVCRVN